MLVAAAQFGERSAPRAALARATTGLHTPREQALRLATTQSSQPVQPVGLGEYRVLDNQVLDPIVTIDHIIKRDAFYRDFQSYYRVFYGQTG